MFYDLNAVNKQTQKLKKGSAVSMLPFSSVAEYKEFKATTTRRGAVVHFGASWCAPCAELNDYFEKEVIPAYREVIEFRYVDVELLGEICELEEVESVPFVAIFRAKKKVDGEGFELDRVADVAGAVVSSITQNLISLFGAGAAGKESFSSMDDYIKHLLHRDKIIVFITGTPSRPRCGFTRKIVGLLDDYKVNFSYFDIMSDNELCERLKSYSNWPTFPQVYVDGELIGGCDVCQQMHEEGELKAALKA